jgi:hypothetical protein
MCTDSYPIVVIMRAPPRINNSVAALPSFCIYNWIVIVAGAVIIYNITLPTKV